MSKIARYVFVPAIFLLLAACHGSSSGVLPSSPPVREHIVRTQSNAAGTYASGVLGDSPVQYMQLNESSGPTAVDSSPTKVNGTYVGTVTYNVSGPLLNESSTAISLPGGTAGEGVSMPNPAVAAGTSFSIMTWVYPTLGAQYMTVWGYSYTHRLLVSAGGQLLSQFNGNFFSKGKMTTNSWHLVVFVYNAQNSTESYYIDGNFDSSAALANSAAAFNAKYYLGQYDASVNYKFKGRLAHHAFFNSALSAAQISSLYTSAGYGGAIPAPTPSSSPSPSPSPSASPTPGRTPGPATYTDWSTFGDSLQGINDNPNESTITAANASNLRLDWSANLGSAITAQPVLATNVTVNGVVHNLLYVGTEGGIFYAIDADTGTTVWSVNLGTVTSTCKDLPNGVFGITGAATFDRASNRVYVADGNDAVHALDMSTHQEAPGWPISVSSTKSEDHIYGALNYNPANGMLYVETASFCDTPPWHGEIAAINTSNATIAAQFSPASPYQGAGMWGTGGIAIDPTTQDVYIATGNTITGPSQTSESAAYGDQVVHLTSGLSVVAANYPGLTGDDVDFGATPMLFQPGACPQEVTAKNKSGVVVTYLAGSIGATPPQSLAMAINTSAGRFIGVTAYSPSTGYTYVGNPNGITPATGVTYYNGIQAMSADPNCNPGFVPTPAWQAMVGPTGVTANDNDSPTVAGNVVFLTDGIGKQVFAFNAATGAQLWNSGSTITGPVMNAATVDGRVFVGSWDQHLYAFGF